jgi:methionyl aminopeptidase
LTVAIRLKKSKQIERMHDAGRVVRLVLDALGEMIAPGVTTEELDAEAERLCHSQGAECLFKGVPGVGGPFPGNICCSINEEVVHGIPSGDRILRDGDIVSVDFGVRLAGWCGDAAETFLCGTPEPDVGRLVSVTRQALAMVVEMARPGLQWSQIASVMQDYVEGEGFSVVREFVGHGIGRSMHEDPKIPNHVAPEMRRADFLLAEGMVLAVEPMVNLGSERVQMASDGWTIVTADGKPSAHFEHTLAITSNGVRVLTGG